MQGMPIFSLMRLPSLASTTASVSPSAFFLRNFLRFLLILESTKEAADSRASVVFSNLEKALSLATCFYERVREGDGEGEMRAGTWERE